MARGAISAKRPLRRPLDAGLADELVVLTVRANPEPMDAALHGQAESAVVKADADADELTDRLEMERRMGWLGAQQGVIPPRERLYIRGQRLVALLEPLRRCVPQSSRWSPCSKSA